MKKDKLSLYLAGNLGNWREKVIEILKDRYLIYNPLINSRQDCPLYFVPDDLKAAANCDILLAYRPRKGLDCPAMWDEFREAWENKKMVILVDETVFPDPFIFNRAKRTFTKLNIAIDYLKYLADKGNEIEALHKVI